MTIRNNRADEEKELFAASQGQLELERLNRIYLILDVTRESEGHC